MTPKPSWQSILLLAAGVFIGSYWLMDGYFQTLRLWEAGPGLPAVFPLIPGIAILALVLLARRAPVPYGTGLILLGLMAVFFFSRRGPVSRALAMGAPLSLVGLGFLIWRNKFKTIDGSRD